MGDQQAGGSPSESMFDQPYIDRDEWRDEPVRHRYVHGGFKGTDTRFSLYFPEKADYEGRFYQYVTPVPDSETLSQGASGEENRIGFAIASGAYFIETNGGGRAAAAMKSNTDPSIGAYRANAATARYSRQLAMEMYEGDRPYGYLFGGSGGAFRTIAGMENTDDVWDGAVPYVVGSPMALPNVFTVRAYALRVLADELPAIADAVDVGSRKSPFDGLDDEQRAALEEVTRMGFPLEAWHAWDDLGLHAFTVIYPGVRAMDPGYFEDFWNKKGYEGFDPTPSLREAMVSHPTTVEKVIALGDTEARALDLDLPGQAHGEADDAWKALQGTDAAKEPVALKLASAPDKDWLGADLIFRSGKAEGERLLAARIQGDLVVPGSAKRLANIEAGDKLEINNRDFLAAQTYHRHQVPGEEFYVWDQFRGPDGEPLYPQRPMLLGPLLARGAGGDSQTGKFSGKMILVENLYDTEAFPWQADWYRSQVKEHLGEKTDERFRLWYTDHANHGDKTEQKDPTHTVSYIGVLHQALRDLSAWVEEGTAPPASTEYKIDDGQVVVPDSAQQRKGIQPVVRVTAGGDKREDVAVGESVELRGVVDIPPAGGKVVSAEWDFEGTGEYPRDMALTDIEMDDGRAVVTTTYRFDQPGTYFPTLRVATQRQGDTETPYARVQNLGRVRVVVHPEGDF